MVSWVGDEATEAWLKPYADANSASDIRTHLNTRANAQTLGTQHQISTEVQLEEADCHIAQHSRGRDRIRRLGSA
eukprot:8905641-Pyramimonas_sp.AAC.1